MKYTWWNTIPLHMDPVALSIGSFQVRWYGLMYLVAFFLGYWIIWHFAQKEKLKMKREQWDSILTWIIVGVLLGARLGEVVFWNFSYYARHPLEIFLPFSWEGGFHFTGIAGMSYHGGLIGATICGFYAIRKHKLEFWKTVNCIFFVVPLVYTFGRLGNFINGELYGRVTTSSIGMLFPHAPDFRLGVLRHPSQLYEMCFEGFVLFGVLYALVKAWPFLKDYILAMYLIGYGLARFVIEYFREVDQVTGLILGITRGQQLCLLMMLAGGLLWVYLARLQKRESVPQKAAGRAK
jgi:phosphatidylglycerol:prolipoprotein diacylglycerol transferase